MGVELVPSLSSHAFRAARRRAAAVRREHEVEVLRVRLVRAEKELASWERWWWGDAGEKGQCAEVIGQAVVQEKRVALTGNAVKTGRYAELPVDKVVKGKFGEPMGDAVVQGKGAELTGDTVVHGKRAELIGDAVEQGKGADPTGAEVVVDKDAEPTDDTVKQVKCAEPKDDAVVKGRVLPSTFLDNVSVEEVAVFRRDLRRQMVMLMPKEVFDDPRRCVDRVAFISEIAAQMGALTKVPAHLRQPVLQHVGVDVTCVFETLEECVARCGVRQQQEWAHLTAKERQCWQTQYDIEKVSYDEAHQAWTHGRSQTEPKRPTSAFFAWMKSRADERWGESRVEAASLVSSD